MERVTAITLEQEVLINGIYGYIDFIGQDVIQLVDNLNKCHIINVSEIKEVFSKTTELRNNLAVYYLN